MHPSAPRHPERRPRPDAGPRCPLLLRQRDLQGRPGGSRSLRCGRRMLRVRQGQLRPGRVEAGARPRVAYLGIDDNFFGAGQVHHPGQRRRSGSERAPVPLLYASVLSGRKGAETLMRGHAARRRSNRVGPGGGRIRSKPRDRHGATAPSSRIRGSRPLAACRDPTIGADDRPRRLRLPELRGGVRPGRLRGPRLWLLRDHHAERGSIVEDGVHGALVPAGRCADLHRQSRVRSQSREAN